MLLIVRIIFSNYFLYIQSILRLHSTKWQYQAALKSEMNFTKMNWWKFKYTHQSSAIQRSVPSFAVSTIVPRCHLGWLPSIQSPAVMCRSRVLAVSGWHCQYRSNTTSNSIALVCVWSLIEGCFCCWWKWMMFFFCCRLVWLSWQSCRLWPKLGRLYHSTLGSAQEEALLSAYHQSCLVLLLSFPWFLSVRVIDKMLYYAEMYWIRMFLKVAKMLENMRRCSFLTNDKETWH